MAKKSIKGTCLLCKSAYGRTGMGRHLQSCLPKSLQEEANDQGGKLHPFFLIQVSGRYANDYRMYLKVNSSTALKVLDNFLGKA